jgi:hypothetical protein
MSLIRAMSTRKRAIFINGWGILGIAVSMFALPGDIPFWIWAVSAIAALVLLNCVAFWGRKPQLDAPYPAQRVSPSTYVIYGGALLLIIDLIWTYYAKHRSPLRWPPMGIP